MTHQLGNASGAIGKFIGDCETVRKPHDGLDCNVRFFTLSASILPALTTVLGVIRKLAKYLYKIHVQQWATRELPTKGAYIQYIKVLVGSLQAQITSLRGELQTKLNTIKSAAVERPLSWANFQDVDVGALKAKK